MTGLRMQNSSIRVAGFLKIFVDSLVLSLCLIVLSKLYNSDLESIERLFYAVSFYLIVFCDVVVAFVLGFSTTIFSHQRVNMLTMSVLRFLIDLAIIQFFNYVFLKERLGVYSPVILIFSLFITCVFAVFWRLLFFESLYFDKKYRVFCDLKYEAMIKKDLHTFKGDFQYFAVNDFAGQINDIKLFYVIQDASLNKDELQQLMQMKMQGFKILTISQFYEQILRKIPVELVSMRGLIFESGFELTSRMFLQRTKRVVDVVLSILLFLITWPLILIFGILHKFESAGPVFYTQTRTGKKGELFTIYKLRSMRANAEAGGAVWAQSNDPRITKIGQFTRVTRIDELPQLLNVLKGDMSFIGPRPERPEFNSSLAEQVSFYELRHSVRPGLTGWAQVKYPYGASVEDSKEKLQYDLFYIKNYSLLLDFEILMKTVFVVFFRKGR
jgi:lipopolysaccharide/colanic/teichoic acid biosynthesis glycosyltransferase